MAVQVHVGKDSVHSGAGQIDSVRLLLFPIGRRRTSFRAGHRLLQCRFVVMLEVMLLLQHVLLVLLLELLLQLLLELLLQLMVMLHLLSLLHVQLHHLLLLWCFDTVGHPPR